MRRTRTGFTLIELLVVIAIISILAALIMAGVQKTRESARNVQCRADIQQLETALGQFQARFKSYPPPVGPTPPSTPTPPNTGTTFSGPRGMFMLATSYTTTDPEYVYLLSMFERMSSGDNGLRKLSLVNGTYVPTPANATNIATHAIPRNTVFLDPNQALVFFLSGGVFTGYTGFSTNPQTPFLAPDTTAGATAGRLNNGPFFDAFTPSRMQSRRGWTAPKEYNFPADGTRFTGDTAPSPDTDQPWFVDPWGTPYLYFAARNGNDYPYTNTTISGAGSQNGLKVGPWGGEYSPNNIPEGCQPFYTGVTGSAPNVNAISTQRLLNIKGFQIISAGRDRMFGPGGGPTNYSTDASYKPGAGAYALNRRGGDDYSNFQQTPLGVTD